MRGQAANWRGYAKLELERLEDIKRRYGKNVVRQPPTQAANNEMTMWIIAAGNLWQDVQLESLTIPAGRPFSKGARQIARREYVARGKRKGKGKKPSSA